MRGFSTSTEDTNRANRLILGTRYPNCWTIEVSEEMEACAIAHTTYNTSRDTVKGHFTVYAERFTEISNFVKAARDSRLTDSLTELSSQHRFDNNMSNIADTTREILVEYDPASSMTDALLEYGFVHDGPVRINNGWEYRKVIDNGYVDLNERVSSLETEMDAKVVVDETAAISKSGEDTGQQRNRLSNRQREVLDLARKHDYYAWPRGTTTRELADELDISKTTLLEHLRKAEAKLLNQ